MYISKIMSNLLVILKSTVGVQNCLLSNENCHHLKTETSINTLKLNKRVSIVKCRLNFKPTDEKCSVVIG